VVDRLLGLRFRIPSGALMSITCGCCEMSGRGLCDGQILLPEEFYRLRCVCDKENLKLRGHRPTRTVEIWRKLA
jgi:hypothetical protein